MPIKQAAKKALRQAKKLNQLNLARTKVMKNVTKQIKKLVVAGKKGEALKLIPTAYKAIDKAAKRGIIKLNAAARKKSRLMKSLLK
jgi:small subunit ribosomal protein S20